jgi:hypothetical protein
LTSWVEQITTTAPVACFDTPEGVLETLPEGVFFFLKRLKKGFSKKKGGFQKNVIFLKRLKKVFKLATVEPLVGLPDVDWGNQ